VGEERTSGKKKSVQGSADMLCAAQTLAILRRGDAARGGTQKARSGSERRGKTETGGDIDSSDRLCEGLEKRETAMSSDGPVQRSVYSHEGPTLRRGTLQTGRTSALIVHKRVLSTGGTGT